MNIEAININFDGNGSLFLGGGDRIVVLPAYLYEIARKTRLKVGFWPIYFFL